MSKIEEYHHKLSTGEYSVNHILSDQYDDHIALISKKWALNDQYVEDALRKHNTSGHILNFQERADNLISIIKARYKSALEKAVYVAYGLKYYLDVGEVEWLPQTSETSESRSAVYSLEKWRIFASHQFSKVDSSRYTFNIDHNVRSNDEFGYSTAVTKDEFIDSLNKNGQEISLRVDSYSAVTFDYMSIERLGIHVEFDPKYGDPEDFYASVKITIPEQNVPVYSYYQPDRVPRYKGNTTARKLPSINLNKVGTWKHEATVSGSRIVNISPLGKWKVKFSNIRNINGSENYKASDIVRNVCLSFDCRVFDK